MIGFLNIHVWATGFYIDASQAANILKDKKEEDIFTTIIKGGFTRRIHAITCRALTTSQLSSGFKDTLESRLPRDKFDEVDGFCEKVTGVGCSEVIHQTFDSDNNITIKFGNSESNTFSSTFGNAILQSAFDSNTTGKTPGWEIRRKNLIGKLPDVLSATNSTTANTVTPPVITSDTNIPVILPQPTVEAVKLEISKEGYLMKRMPMRWVC